MDTDTKQVLLYFNTKHPHAGKKKKNMKLGKFIQLKARLYCKYNAALYINDMQPTAPTNSSRTEKKRDGFNLPNWKRGSFVTGLTCSVKGAHTVFFVQGKL